MECGLELTSFGVRPFSIELYVWNVLVCTSRLFRSVALRPGMSAIPWPFLWRLVFHVLQQIGVDGKGNMSKLVMRWLLEVESFVWFVSFLKKDRDFGITSNSKLLLQTKSKLVMRFRRVQTKVQCNYGLESNHWPLIHHLNKSLGHRNRRHWKILQRNQNPPKTKLSDWKGECVAVLITNNYTFDLIIKYYTLGRVLLINTSILTLCWVLYISSAAIGEVGALAKLQIWEAFDEESPNLQWQTKLLTYIDL